MSYAGLSNEQIVFIYLRLKKYAEYVNDLVMQGYLTKEINIDIEEITIQTGVTDEDLNVILDIPLVKYYMSIEETLRPIVELIKESDPDLYDKVEYVLEEADNGNLVEEDPEEGNED